MAKVMLVEDDNNLREIYEARLLAEGYEIVSARDGEEALALAVKERPDLIIADVMMPKISGFDMLDILRSTPETKNTKVVIMTALSQAEDKARAVQLGADKYLVKSQVTLEDVAKVAREVLEGTPSTTAATSQPEPLAPLPAAIPVAIDPVAAATTDPIVQEQNEVNRLSESVSASINPASQFNEDVSSGVPTVNGNSTTSVHTKVVEPLNPEEMPKTDINELLAEQDRKDTMAKAVETLVNKPATTATQQEPQTPPTTRQPENPIDPNLISL